MITYLKGRLAFKDPTHLVVDVGGVGYEVKISLITYSQVKDKEDILIQTYLHVKEDSHTLFGFYEQSEKKRFLDLLSINGVGPSTALMILSSLDAKELQAAIVQEDVKTIQSVKGIGGKTAQRIILELKDKMKKEGLLDKSVEIQPRFDNTLRSEALSALTTLGINKSAAEKTVDKILKEYGEEIKLEELIKHALKRS
ncbi:MULTISPECIES: Holliday junction branch migration protein RuvA [unclassified Ekhidna]|jgi:Holliday junction DNA helicase RuvA|uniref:Holliday junction branch migration protein RuvA n=1 Tax=unclassified Ekhidna TaxID=2632188 RepID=UPI0032DE949A